MPNEQLIEGAVFGKWTVVGGIEGTDRTLVKCDCGRVFYRAANVVKRGLGCRPCSYRKQRKRESAAQGVKLSKLYEEVRRIKAEAWERYEKEMLTIRANRSCV